MAELAAYSRGHWGIENLMASLRNLAPNAPRLAGHASIATGLCTMARNHTRPLTLLGIQP